MILQRKYDSKIGILSLVVDELRMFHVVPNMLLESTG